MKDKWKEKTKLNSIEIKEIIVQVLLAIIYATIAIIDKEYIYFLASALEIVIAIQTYYNAKLLKSKEAIIELKNEEIEHKNDLINTLLMRESRK